MRQRVHIPPVRRLLRPYPEDMVHFFRRDPARVSWQLTTDSGSYRLVVYHADGMIVERYGSPEQALRRVHQLEDYLNTATTDVASPRRVNDGE
jgi:hypothetical protein